jgi:hypothetical protein
VIAKAQLRPGPALDFVAFELLVQFGWRMSVRGLQLLVVALCALAVPMVTTIAVVAILLLVIWPFVVEPALKGMTPGLSWEPARTAAAYLPYAAGQAISSAPRAGTGSLYASAHAASPAVAALAFAGLVCALIWSAAVMFRNRPVAI